MFSSLFLILSFSCKGNDIYLKSDQTDGLSHLKKLLLNKSISSDFTKIKGICGFDRVFFIENKDIKDIQSFEIERKKKYSLNIYDKDFGVLAKGSNTPSIALEYELKEENNKNFLGEITFKRNHEEANFNFYLSKEDIFIEIEHTTVRRYIENQGFLNDLQRELVRNLLMRHLSNTSSGRIQDIIKTKNKGFFHLQYCRRKSFSKKEGKTILDITNYTDLPHETSL